MAITVPGREDLDQLAARLQRAGLQYADTEKAITVNDPWNTPVTVAIAGSTTTEDLLAKA